MINIKNSSVYMSEYKHNPFDPNSLNIVVWMFQPLGYHIDVECYLKSFDVIMLNK